MNEITIPNYATLQLEHVVLDYNGTIAKDGILKEDIKELIRKLCENYTVHIVTADTFGSVAAQSEDLDIVLKILTFLDHTQEKADYIKALGSKHCAAFGNGNNDAKMLESAALGIAVMGDEGCASATLLASDVVCKDIVEALELLLQPKRLIATLRR